MLLSPAQIADLSCSHAAWWLAGTAGPAAEGRLEMLECWHLTADDMAALTKECLLPLAEMHASLGLARSLQPEGALAVVPKPQQTGRYFPQLQRNSSDGKHDTRCANVVVCIGQP